jgi:hypothetical protein
MEKNCIVCYFPIDSENYIKCSNDCKNEICFECCESYIEHYYNDNKEIPKCPSTLCKNGEYLINEIRKLNNSEIIKKYNMLYINYLKNDKLDDILAETNQKLFIEKIRKEREEFIFKEFPAAISFVIDKALKTKLKKIDKINQDHIKDLKRKTNRKCLNPLCYSGILDVDFKCLSCFKQFCKKCEVKIKDDIKHECKEEDLESIKLVNSFVKCPKCKFPVVRSYGCNYITCSICKTNFDYITGHITSLGNHSNDTATLKIQKPLSIQMMENNIEDKGIYNCMRKIETLEPENYSFNNIISEFKKYVKLENETLEKGEDLSTIENDLERLREIIILNYQKYQDKRIKKQKYFKLVDEIDEAYNNKTLNIEFINKIHYLIIKIVE